MAALRWWCAFLCTGIAAIAHAAMLPIEPNLNNEPNQLGGHCTFQLGR
jgi:hypothetical protein